MISLSVLSVSRFWVNPDFITEIRKNISDLKPEGIITNVKTDILCNEGQIVLLLDEI